MIRVTIEIYDGSTTELSQIIAIKNDGTGSADLGSYDVEAVGADRVSYLRAKVEGFPRQKHPVLQLVRRALNALWYQMKSEAIRTALDQPKQHWGRCHKCGEPARRLCCDGLCESCEVPEYRCEED